LFCILRSTSIKGYQTLKNMLWWSTDWKLDYLHNGNNMNKLSNMMEIKS